ncbi:MAG: alkaline phosphatase D family protein [Opitutales bacterium]
MTLFGRAFVFLLFTLPALPLCAQLASGPMLGPVDHREAIVWVQTEEPAEVHAEFWPLDTQASTSVSPRILTRAEEHFTAHLVLGPLEPGTQYGYRVYIDGETIEPDAANFHTPPDFRDRFPPPDVFLAFVGGHYVNDRPYDPLNRIPGAGYEIYEAIAQVDPFALIWLGNTVHLREPDWGSPSGMAARFQRGRNIPELASLLAGTPQWGTWGRHDAGPPDLLATGPDREWSRAIFRDFWPRRGRGIGGPGADNDLATTLRVSDVELFLLDDRSHRNLAARSEAHRIIYGEPQLDWLLWRLRTSPATFKVVCSASAILNPAEGPGNATQAPREREGFLEALRQEKIGGVLFITGGKPFGELTRLVRSRAQDLHELTVGPATARPAERTDEINYLREPGTTTRQRHFVLARFHGPEGQRQVTLSVRDTNGEELWSRTLSEEALSWDRR